MRKKLAIVAAAAVGLNFVFVPHSNGGTDMIIDNSRQAPPPVYRYAAPPPVYYVPPPVVAVYPTYGYYARPVRVFGFQHFHAHRARGFWHRGH